MTKAKNTKRALLTSVLSLMLCMAMLVGSTFAWFTDTVTSGVNKIVAGNLDVEMDYAVLNDDGSFKEWKSVEGESLFDENALWEPGYTQVVYLRVRNVGSLSLNYKLSVDIPREIEGKRYDKEERREIPFYLSDYLKFGTVESDSENFFADRDAARAAIGEDAGELKNYSATGSIKASEKDTDIKYIALVVYMPETVGNEANHYKTFAPEITLGIKLEAHQMVDEADSFGNNYDKDAFQNEAAFADLTKDAFEVKTVSDLLKLEDLVRTGTTFENKTITLANNIALTEENWKPIGAENAPFKGTFDGNNCTISGLSITEATYGVAGLFGQIEGATIQNLTVDGSITLSGSEVKMVGGICANTAKESSTIDNCINKVTIDVSAVTSTSAVIVGGIVGNIQGTISNCVNAGNITAPEMPTVLVGGITAIKGWATGAKETNSNTGTITGGTSTPDKLYGIAY